jgi:transposase InsO family protein
MEPVFIHCSHFIPGYHDGKQDKPHMLVFHKLLVITDVATDFTYLIPCIAEISASDVIDIFQQFLKPAMGLPKAIISDQDILFMSGTFQHWLNVNGIEHKVSSTYHPETDGISERKNRTILPMFIVKKIVEELNWVEATPIVQTEVNTKDSKSRKKSPFISKFGYAPKLGATLLPHPIPIFSDPTKRFYEIASNLTSAKKEQIK